MKRACLGLFVMGVLATTTAFAQERFTDRLTAEERKAAGLGLLTPEQLAVLDALVRRDRESGEKRVREEVTREVKAQAKVEAQKEEDERQLAETRVLSRIVGRYDGWEGSTVFKLENGQVWRQASPDVHYVKSVESPAVLIEKVYGGWRLYDQNGGWVRVVRIK
jgi:hypothetical protein